MVIVMLYFSLVLGLKNVFSYECFWNVKMLMDYGKWKKKLLKIY